MTAARLPDGFRLAGDPSTRWYAGGRVLASRSRVLRLTPDGATVAARLLAGEPVDGRAAAALARRLLDAGLAHPAGLGSGPPYEVVVPAYGAHGLDRTLTELSCTAPVVVVDDGSPSPIHDGPIRVVRHDRNRGPAAARNTGMRATTADIVAFVDSGVEVCPDTLASLAAHFGDPAVAAVAPRIRPAARSARSVLARFADAYSPLDLGPRSGPVTPGGRPAFVPSTVLLVRRSAIEHVGGFDERLRVGEDVDLVWRLADRGWTVRYAAEVDARHDEPDRWSRWLARRYRYGTSAGALSRSPGGWVLSPSVPRLAALRLANLPLAADALVSTARWLTQTWWPMLALGLARRGKARTTCATVLLVPPLAEALRRKPRLDPLRWTAAVLADDVAYGFGVWVGCVRAKTARPLLPRLVTRTTRNRNVPPRP